MTLELPWPPSVNHYWLRTRKGVVIGAAGRQYRHTATVLGRQANMYRGNRPFIGPLRVQIEAFPPDRIKRDIDNVFKAPLDALSHAGVWEDDNQVADLRIIRHAPIKGGKLIVTITHLAA